MNVLFYSSYSLPYISGMTLYTKRVLSALKKKGVHVTHLFFYPTKPTTKEDVSIPFFIQLYKGFISFQSPFVFWNAVKKNNVVCINYPNAEAIPLIICALILRKKIVTFFHCTVQLSNPLLSIIFTPLLSLSLFIHLTASTSVIAQEDYISSYWWSRFFKKKYVYADPPIDVPKEKLIKKINKSVGFIGRISSEKGIEYLIGALCSMKIMTLYLVGPSHVQGESSYMKKIVKLLKQSKIKYHFIPDPTEVELYSHISQMEMIVLPSVNKTEAFGMVQPEAMCRGTAVIATDLPGVRIPIKNSHMGLLVPPKNTQAIIEAISTIHNNLDTYANKELTHRALFLFSPTKTYEIIYNTLTSSLI